MITWQEERRIQSWSYSAAAAVEVRSCTPEGTEQLNSLDIKHIVNLNNIPLASKLPTMFFIGLETHTAV